MKSKYFFLIYVFFLLSSCQSIKDGLAGNKNENSDEFLIEKKNPLEIPPDFGVLPIPNKKNREIDEVQKIDEEIEKLLKKENTSKDDQNVGNSAEDFVLKQIKKN
tara:strand:+ start:112 stop:426 length:315 start_codon:yes stop_codon:yes gene_type:complete